MTDWNKDTIHETVLRQKNFFMSNQTLDVRWRLAQLKKLKDAVIRYRSQMEDALAMDLKRHPVEAYFCDIGSLITEINEMIAGLKKWAKPEVHYSGIMCFPSVVTKVYHMPYGVTLIIAPFNFPFLLSLSVLAASLAGGNTAVIKASSKSSACSEVLCRMVAATFPPEYVTVVTGSHEVADFCLEEKFDKIFYTGSPRVGKHILAKAADNLIPCALELGGETGNWCIVRKDADLADAARKIAFFKLCNSGQICININQVAVAREVVYDFLTCLKKELRRQIGVSAIANPEYPCLISDQAYDRCEAEVKQYRERIVCGGYGNRELRKFEPTVIFPVDVSEPIVQHELFSPLLPVVPFDDNTIDTLLHTIASREKPLAFYLFTKDKAWAEKTMRTMQFGGGCVNEVCVHMMVKGVPFNGVGHSGMGAYHGEWGFREFTHPQTVLFGSSHLNLSLREHPYETPLKKALIQLFER
ncbi:MAG: aldehyde dehydrogenase family protein [Solobacterium sp.]|nr:aldehyde dehydrogenase family protein [Solobacterium sp.]